MNNLKQVLIAVLLIGLFVAPTAYADKEALKKILAETMPSITVDDISDSEIKGLYEVMVGADVLYVSEDGKYLIQGHMFDLVAKKDLTEGKLAKARAALINGVAKDQMIIFKAPKQKYTITIFTDIDCGYCRKLHSEIDQYLAEGITVQYLFYPRAGKDSESYKKAVSVWCADDRNAALTAAKSSSNPPPVKMCKNPVDKHMALGEALGVRGTPMMVTAKGTIFPGYMPAKRLAAALAQDK
ncbi:DsbC family protein [methanotrophic endosymbiont of Bathymodiolus puteoserpentis (Logatchev)]|jgi:thiol:disulfide interchange protein DsbC|uniref:DsbC family protein n=1 Tax=methanotrophic endosymbiont of Bathymodiolus puteoserpentis (Logatchev) TaxID=343235 RepID=UPI0013CBBA33|nr:DsbC family protein [methanotrophic endosymbiont of Bathymodiolus puteoserpentis (Logatchev)]SHE20135.1 Thiol:disulfide interchange protein DsbC [methanotrophic endosymbiont of Bathymodiolus puteoserpentis (Logatchev)]